MLIIAYEWDGVIKHTVPHRYTVTAEYYCIFLQDNLQAALRRKRQCFLNNPLIILHDNARAYAAGAVTDLLNRWCWEVLYQPTYSSDLCPCVYDIFLKMKGPFCEMRFCTVHEVLQTTNRWECMMHNGGCYVKGL